MADEVEMESVRYSSGFKLFGAVIVTNKRRTNKGLEAGEPEDDNMTVAAAAAAATVAEEGEVSPALPCPRCKSQETKFCYFNNYNVNQPRHLCKACHRYWTAGGAIRNVPVGGGRRQNRQAP